MTEEELKAAQKQLESDRKALEADRRAFEENATTQKITAKYKADIKKLQKELADRDAAISELLDGKQPEHASNGNNGELSADFKKLLRY